MTTLPADELVERLAEWLGCVHTLKIRLAGRPRADDCDLLKEVRCARRLIEENGNG